MQAFLNLFKSRKFWLTIIGTALMAIVTQLPLDDQIKQYLIAGITAVFGINIHGIAKEDAARAGKSADLS